MCKQGKIWATWKLVFESMSDLKGSVSVNVCNILTLLSCYTGPHIRINEKYWSSGKMWNKRSKKSWLKNYLLLRILLGANWKRKISFFLAVSFVCRLIWPPKQTNFLQPLKRKRENHFLGATKHLYNWLCPLVVRWSVGWSVCNAFVRQSTCRTLLAYLALFPNNPLCRLVCQSVGPSVHW